ncbi:hypothetical protein [Treponema denticola]|uniref:hypothetical protein n=1 Tax=Treponema denticola TaxID=158 RepID=UPI0020A3E884|nr:hypothetical protein [Treponema denticola]UTC82654.1 hypothetical protein HGJ18_05325 [Treponema denticola]
MEFDKSKVYTAVNADELKVGSKCIFADTVRGLRRKVEEDTDCVETFYRLYNNGVDDLFVGNNFTYCYAYLIEPPDKPKYKPFSNMGNAVEVVKKHGGWIKHKKNNSLLFITGFNGCGIFLGNNYHYDFISLFREFVFANDGSPCGELVEE